MPAFVRGGAAAAILAVAVQNVLLPVPAQARDGVVAGIAAGALAGVAAGAILSAPRPYYAPAPAYYPPPPAYYGPPCYYEDREVWDPYRGGYVLVHRRVCD
jgi:hypothetical protein